MVVGPALARFGRGYIPTPGGDKIGRRRLDTHFIGFEKLGAEFSYDEKEAFYKAEAKKLKGAYMLLDEASVTGTANIVMAAVLAEGTHHDLQRRVRTLPAAALRDARTAWVRSITGVGSNLLHIDGVKELRGTEHTPVAGHDRDRLVHRPGGDDAQRDHHQGHGLSTTWA